MFSARPFEFAVPATLFATTMILLGARYSMSEPQVQDQPPQVEAKTPKAAPRQSAIPNEVPSDAEDLRLMSWDGNVENPPSNAIILAEWDALHELATSGNAEAQYRLGGAISLRSKENSEEFSVDKTLVWLRAAADQNHRDACRELASFYQ